MTDARLAGLATQVALVIDPATVSARLAGLVTQVAVRIPPLDPLTVTATQASSTSITLSWTDPVGGNTRDHYEVKLDNGAPVNKGASTSHTFTGLTTGLTYYVLVRSVDADGFSNGWIERGLNLLAAPADNPFMGSPWNEGSGVFDVDGARWEQHPTFTGDGVAIPADLSTVPIDRTFESDLIPGLRGGVNVNLRLAEVMRKSSLNRKVANTAGYQSSGPGNPVVLVGQKVLEPGSYIAKAIWLVDANIGGNNTRGNLWVQFLDGTVTRVLGSLHAVEQSGPNNSYTRGQTAAGTQYRGLGRSQRGNNNTMGNIGVGDGSSLTALWVGHYAFTITAQATLGYDMDSSVGGGNHIGIYDGSVIFVRKVL